MTERDAIERDSRECGPLLRLLAFDLEDLSVVSAHLQDAVVRWADMTFVPAERRFVLLADRFDWCAAGAGRTERLAAGLHFECVTKVLFHGRKPGGPDAQLTLLSISFEESDRPSGSVLLTFTSGETIRLDVECLEGHLRDLGPRRTVAEKPGHGFEVADGAP